MTKKNNYKLLIFATEAFTQFAYFLETYRNYKNLNIKIGEFEYDDWKAYIYLIMDETGVYFKHKRLYDSKEWTHKTLTEQFIYAWDFENIEFKINFDIINNFCYLLTDLEKDYYYKLYDEVHCKFW